MNRIFVFCLLSLACMQIPGQDLSLIGKSEPLQITGSAGLQYYGRPGHQSGSPYPSAGTIWQVGLTASLYGWNLPFSATYSNASLRWQQPFNRLSLQPSWKWIRIYLGDASMNFSPYSLNGHQFTGAGTELEPAGGKWKISVMGGRLLRQTFPDTLHGLPGVRQRMGYGLAGEYHQEKFSFGAGIFYASDEKNNRAQAPDSLLESPAENLVFHFRGTAGFIENLQVQYEYAVSFFTPDRRGPELKPDILYPMEFRNGSARYNAFKTGATYTTGIGSIGLSAERVDPGYKTLGAYYHLNDFENYTFRYAGAALQKKLTWSVSSGWQYDNLARQKRSTSRRLLHHLNMTYIPSDALQVNITYSDFSRYMYLRPAQEYLSSIDPWKEADTLHYRQVTGTWGGNAFWQKEDRAGNRHQVSFTYSRNISREQSADTLSSRGRFVSASGGYTFTKPGNALSCSTIIQYNNSQTGEISSAYLGPAFSLRKSLAGKKIQAYSIFSYNKTWQDKEKTGHVLTGRGGISCRQKSHTFDLTLGTAWRTTAEHPNRKEFTVDFSYRYSFSVKKEKEKKEFEN